ncbi:MAG: tetratricopeptide repeat protein [Bradymonadia bacterium]
MPAEHEELLLDELNRLREELVQTRNLSIKTENQIKGLSAEIKGIAAEQISKDKRQYFNSAIAYVLFCALAFTGLWLTFQARLEKAQVDQTLFEKKQTDLQQKMVELQAELGRWKQIERELLEFERLVKEGKKEQAVEAFSALKRVRFSGLLQDLIVRFSQEVGREQYEKGLTYYEQGNFNLADEAFLKSLDYNDDPPYLGVLLYHQGMSALRLKDFARAGKLLRTAQGKNIGDKRLADARYHLAYAHDRLGEKRTARDLYRSFFKRYANHRFTPRAKRRYEQLTE